MNDVCMCACVIDSDGDSQSGHGKRRPTSSSSSTSLWESADCPSRSSSPESPSSPVFGTGDRKVEKHEDKEKEDSLLSLPVADGDHHDKMSKRHRVFVRAERTTTSSSPSTSISSSFASAFSSSSAGSKVALDGSTLGGSFSSFGSFGSGRGDPIKQQRLHLIGGSSVFGIGHGQREPSITGTALHALPMQWSAASLGYRMKNIRALTPLSETDTKTESSSSSTITSSPSSSSSSSSLSKSRSGGEPLPSLLTLMLPLAPSHEDTTDHTTLISPDDRDHTDKGSSNTPPTATMTMSTVGGFDVVAVDEEEDHPNLPLLSSFESLS